MEKYKNTVLMAILISESSHIFCCVLPTLFSLVGLLSGIGLVTAMPAEWVQLHDMLHRWEVPMILFSASMLGAGWALNYYSDKIDCHDTGCCHGPCAPKKSKVQTVLKIATVLFVVNVLIYGVFHRGMGISPVHVPHYHLTENVIR